MIRERVCQARALQQERYREEAISDNAGMQQAQLRKYCALDETGVALMRQAFDALHLTARSYDRILRVARTIADLAGSESIEPMHLAEAIRYRSFHFGRE